MLPLTTFPGRFTLTTPAVAVVSTTLATGSATATMADTSVIAGAVGVSGVGVAPGALVASIDSATQITLSSVATATGAKSLTFSLEPVTLAEAKAHLRVPFTTDDALISVLISAARMRCESDIDRAFVNQTFDFVTERFPWVDTEQAIWRWVTNVLTLPKAALQSVASVKYIAYDGTLTTIDPSVYIVRTGSPGAVYPIPYTRLWPLTKPQLDAVTISCTFGYGATAASVPPTIKQAVLMLVGHLYEHRESVTAENMAEVPYGVSYLLASESWGSRP